MEVEISWVEVDGAEWSWVEVDGAGWRWVHGLVIPNQNCHHSHEKLKIVTIWSICSHEK